jgi:hypothetical protein
MLSLSIGWKEQHACFARIKIVCLHIGQMLFAGNKYLLLKRITVQREVKVRSGMGLSPFLFSEGG